MSSPISNLTWVWLRGRYIDLVKAQKGSTQYGLVGKQLTATPKLSPPILRNPALLQHIGAGSAFKATPAAMDGITVLQIPASDDPDLLPDNWHYTITDPLGQTFDIAAPADTPVITDTSDVLYGERVIEMMTITPAANPSTGGSVQVVAGNPGRGISSVDIVSGRFVVTYSDNATQDAGPATGTPDATTSVPGKAVILGGTAAAPTVPWASVTGKPSLATTSDLTTGLAGKAATSHTQSSSTITDFVEAVQDAVAQLLGAGSNIVLNYDDDANSLTVTATGGSGADPELIRDTIGVALAGVGNIAVVVNDAADTITITTTATQNSTDAQLRDRSTHTGSQPQSSVTGLVAALAGKATSSPLVANVRDFGAVGDGVSRPLSTLYGSLAAAQGDYPHADALTCQLDWAAIQKAINSGATAVYYPAGHYLTNRQLVPKNGQDHYGCGYSTWLDNIAPRNLARAGNASENYFDANVFTLGNVGPTIANPAFPQYLWQIADLAPVSAGDRVLTASTPSQVTQPLAVGDIVMVRCDNPPEAAGNGRIYPFQMWNRVTAWDSSSGTLTLENPIPVGIQASPGSPTGTETYLHGPKLMVNAGFDNYTNQPWFIVQDVTVRDMRISGLMVGGRMGCYSCTLSNLDLEVQHTLSLNAMAHGTVENIRSTWTERFIEIKHSSHDTVVRNVHGSYRPDAVLNAGTGPKTTISIGEQSFNLLLDGITCYRGREFTKNVRMLEVYANHVRIQAELYDYATGGQVDVWAVKSTTMLARQPADIDLDLTVRTGFTPVQYGTIGNDANVDGLANDADPTRVAMRLNQRAATAPSYAVRPQRGTRLVAELVQGDATRCLSSAPAEWIERAPNLMGSVTGPISYDPATDTLVGTYTATGVQIGDAVTVGVQFVQNPSSGSTAALSFHASVAAANQITVYVRNRSTSTVATSNAAGSNTFLLWGSWQRLRV